MTRPEPAPGASGRWVLVAGGTGRVGAACAEEFARCGTNVVIHGGGRSGTAKELAAHLAERYRVETRSVIADVTEAGQLDQMVLQLIGDGVSVLQAVVNCTTGYDGRAAGFGALPDHQVRKVVEVDLLGTFFLVQRLMPMLQAGARTAGSAKVVLFSSLAGLRGRAGAAHLCAAKAGVQGLARALALEVAGSHIGVNVVAPGPVTHADPATQPPMPPNVAYSSPGDVAAVVRYLASPESDPVQGQVLVVNGGLP